MSRPLAAVLIAALLVLGACEASPRVDPLSEDLLDEHGLRATSATTVRDIEIWEFAEDGMPWQTYLESSRRIGLDFAADRGKRAELRTTPVGGSAPGLRAHVLVMDGAVIGAWLSSEDDATGSSTISSLDGTEMG